jgi:glycosyltransferase involved in cell wall biosynthesis
MSTLSVLALTKYAKLAASTRHRFLNYIPLLADQGISVTPVSLLDDDYVRRRLSGQKINLMAVARGFVGRLLALACSYRYDVLWIEGELFPRLPALGERLLSKLGCPYVVDLDDAIFHTYDQHPWPLYRLLFARKIDVVLQGAAAVTAGNNYLAERALRAGARNVSVIPTTIDERRYLQGFRQGGRLTFVWIGSSATQHYLQTIQNELEQVCHSLQANLRLIGGEQQERFFPNAELQPWKEESEAIELSCCDIGLAPLYEGSWERGKCGLKAVQYMAAGLPVLAADVGALPSIVKHGETGFLYRDGAEFKSFAQRLGVDPELRRALGGAGQLRASTRYSAHKWAGILGDVLLAAAPAFAATHQSRRSKMAAPTTGDA